MNSSLLEIAAPVSISLLLLLAVYLLLRGSAGNRGFRWIGLFFLLMALNFADGLLTINGFFVDYPHLAGWEEASILLQGPVLLFFARSVTGTRWSHRDLVHLVPFAFAFLASVYAWQALDPDSQRQLLTSMLVESPPAGVLLVQLLAFSHFFTYTGYARSLVKRHQAQLKLTFSSHQISWTLTVFDTLLLLFALSLIGTLLHYFVSNALFLASLVGVVSATILFLFRLLLSALDQPIFSARQGDSHNTMADLAVVEESPVESVGLPAEEVERLQAGIRAYLESESGYADPDLTINDLSAAIGERSREVSQVINRYMADNFYDLVNRYRIEAAERILATEPGPRPTISEVMYQVGFNSKSSFNTQFKRKTGLTPSAYRKATR